MKVKAIRKGYYGHKLKNPGDVFDVENEAYYRYDEAGNKLKDAKGNPLTCTWMEPVDGAAAITSHQSAAPAAVMDEEDEDDDGDAI